MNDGEEALPVRTRCRQPQATHEGKDLPRSCLAQEPLSAIVAKEPAEKTKTTPSASNNLSGKFVEEDWLLAHALLSCHHVTPRIRLFQPTAQNCIAPRRWIDSPARHTQIYLLAANAKSKIFGMVIVP